MKKENVKKTYSEQFYYEEDEIDLYELWLILKKRWKIIFLTVLFFLIISIIYLLLAKPVYHSKVIFKLPTDKSLISTKESIEYTNYLNILLKEKKYEILSNLLSISREEAKYISSIKANSDRKNNFLLFVSIEVYNPDIITKVSNGLLNYLNKNEYLAKNIKVEKELLKLQIMNINSKLGELESLRKIVISRIKKDKIKNLGFNPTEIDISIINLKNRLEDLKVRLKKFKGFELSIPPFHPDKPSKPKKMLILLVSLIGSLFLGVFLAFFLDWLENIKRRNQELEQ